MKKLYLLSNLTLTSIALIYSCSTEEEDTTPPPSIVATPEPEPEPEPTQYTLTVTAGEGGTVSTEGGTYDEGTQISITATPENGYEFVGWEGVDSTEESLSFNINEDRNYFAIFREIISLGLISMNENPIYVGSTYAILELDIQNSGGGNVLNYGVCWSESDDPSIEDYIISQTEYEFGISEFKIKGLEGNKTYFLRSFLENEEGVSYSNMIEINTPSGTNIDQCKLQNNTLQRGVGLGFPINQWRTNSQGTLNISLIFVDFNDAESEKTTEEVFEILTPLSEDFFIKSSYGKLNVKLSPIHKWYRMSKNSESYIFQNGSEHRDYLQEAINLADTENDFNNSDAIIVITNPDALNIANGPAFNGDSYWNLTADDNIYYSGINSGADLTYWGGKWLNHEFFHNLGLPDLYEYGAQSGHGFTGQFSIMGLVSGFSPDIFGFSKWNLNWIEDHQVVCGNSGEFSAFLKPIENNSLGKKIIVFALSDSEAVVVESRRKMELDINLPKEGPLVYVVDTNILSGQGPIKVLPYDYLDQSKSTCILDIGDELIYKNISVRYVQSDKNGDLIEMVEIN